MKTFIKGSAKFSAFFATVLFVLFAPGDAVASDKWELKSHEDGIKVFTSYPTGSDIKSIKALFTVKGTPEMLAGLLLDINKQQDWVYSTKSSTLVKKISEYELVYYTEKSMPWPLSNRDAVMHIKIMHDPATKIMMVRAATVSGVIETQKGIVRVPSSSVTWKVTPVNNHEMNIEYIAQADPGGSVPGWITNMFLTKGPIETFKKLREMLKQQALLS